MPATSILLPVYNAAAYLSECLDSVLAQSHSDWELIAIDNASTDSSLAILQNYAARDARVRVLTNHPNSIITALRKALDASQSHWITRMDADDRMAPDKLKRMQVALEDKEPGHLAVGLVEYFSEGTLGEGYRRYADWLNHLTLENRNFEDRYKECVIPSPCWMCSKTDLLKCGAFDTDRYPEDYDLAFRFYRGGLQVVGIPEVLHYWRDYPTRSSRTQEHYSDNRFLELKVDYFLELDYDSTRPLVIWGTGKKGKTLAQLLLKKGFNFHWLTDNEAKIGRDIYGQIVQHFSMLPQLKNPQVILSVAAPDGRQEINRYIYQTFGKSVSDFFWFC